MVCIPFMKQRFWIQIIHKMGHFLLSTDLFLALNGSMLDRNCYRFLIFATHFLFLLPISHFCYRFLYTIYYCICLIECTLYINPTELYYHIVPLD